LKHTAARQIEEHKDSKKSQTLQLVKRLAGNYLTPYTAQMIVAVIFMAIAGGMTALIAALMQPVLDDVLYSGKEDLIIPVSFGPT
jgi:ABC-type multidrug transport system fused ATPase/permease subunit